VNLSRVIRRFGPPLAAFMVAAFGALLLAGGGAGSVGDDPGELPSLVAVVDIPAGTAIADLGPLVEVRSLPSGALAPGAVQRLGDLPGGVLAIGLVPGQQILASFVAPDTREDVGDELVAVSVTLNPEQWVGPVATTGDRVAIYAIGGEEAALIASDVLVVNAPSDTAGIEPTQQVVVTLGVPRTETARVVGAIAGDGIWLVSS
jgi:hypothetical protein